MTDLISCWKAVSEIAARVGDEGKARSLLIEYLETNPQGVRVDLLLQEADVGDVSIVPGMPMKDVVFRNYPGSIDGEFASLNQFMPEDFLARGDGWAIIDARTRWEVGDFIAVKPTAFSPCHHHHDYNQSTFTRRCVANVKFARAEIDRILDPSHSFPVEVPIPTAKAGRKKKDDDWTAFWMALIQIAQDERLNSTYYSSIKNLSSDVLVEINEKLGESTIKSKISQVYNKFVKINE